MNILIIGLGSIARKHIAAINEIHSESVIYALRSDINAETYGHVKNINSFKELNIKPDFIIISNPTNLHAQAILDSLEIECPLFIEKPVLSNLERADQILKKIQEKNILTYTACNLRFHPLLRFLKQYLLTNKPLINEVNIYCGSYLPNWRPGRDFRTIYSSNASMGGGVHLDVIHEIDYCVWLLGLPMKVYSLKRNVSSLQIDAIDYARFDLIYPQFTANITLNYYRHDTKREIELITKDDTWIMDLIKNSIVSSVSGKIVYEAPFQINETYVAQMGYFISHIKENKVLMNDFKESVEILKIALHE